LVVSFGILHGSCPWALKKYDPLDLKIEVNGLLYICVRYCADMCVTHAFGGRIIRLILYGIWLSWMIEIILSLI